MLSNPGNQGFFRHNSGGDAKGLGDYFGIGGGKGQTVHLKKRDHRQEAHPLVPSRYGWLGTAATLVALGDGTASLHFSSGGGVIGGGPHPSINAAARHLVELAGRNTSKMKPTSEFPLPGSGDTTFYVLTTNGVVRAGAREETLGGGAHPLSELFFAGHEVITGLREVSEGRKR